MLQVVILLWGMLSSALFGISLQLISEHGNGYLFKVFSGSIIKDRALSGVSGFLTIGFGADALVGCFIAALILLHNNGSVHGWAMIGLIAACLQFIVWVHLYGENQSRYRVFIMLGFVAQVKTVLHALVVGETYHTIVWHFQEWSGKYWL